MDLFGKILKFDKRLAGSFIAATALAIVIFLAGVFYNKQPRLRYTLLSQAPVYDVHEDVPDLDIIFRSKSIRQEHKTLSVLTLRIENGGNAGLTLSSFDPNFLPGVRVTHCQIVKITPDVDGNSYLQDALHLMQRSDSEVVFGPMIFDKGDSFLLKFLLLHSETEKPQLESFGKVAGVGKIEVISMGSPADQRGFLARALSGSLATQAFRALVYFIAFLLCVAAIGGTIVGVSEFVTRRRRKRRVKIFERSLGAKPTKQQRLILDIYKDTGAEGVVRLNELLSDSESVTRAVRLYRKYSAVGRHGAARPVTARQFDITDSLFDVRIGRLIEEKMIQEADDVITVDPIAISAAREFEKFLLHHDPEKVLSARGRRQREPYGTDAGPAKEPDFDQQGVAGTNDAPPAQQPEGPPTNE